MSNAHQRNAIVTGGSKGIGAAIARRLARDGFAVSVNYGHDRDAAEAVVAEIIQSGGQAIAVQADLADRSSMATLFNAAEQIFGGVDVLVNNAGTMPLSPLADVDDDQFDRIVGLNLGGVFRGMREAARRMREGGRVISFSSTVVGLYQPTYGVYAATKAAIEAMTHILAKELAPRGITVNAVAPGPVDTGLFRHGKSPEQIAAIEKMNPFGRLGQPDDIASVIAFLAGPDGGWVNGQTIRANGGVV
ncbi:3-oxoacyl-[acyl-carrier protein] reductase [Rhizobium sp. NFR07]|uniref:SDR family oxidoreductase n=1 Tax=Rhizobium sp. NFR07 TaxID=1566262 RepID=UPI0008EB2EF0|nr:SDR family oxidoreductase [Rhizobium sp. NFR07]SFB43074.1 3-oxoacyl-[acyl-carrier protein] reductase [Rhizobium sp. NFR07]